MIAKTTIGRSFKGCCGYNMEKVAQGKGEVLLSQGVRDYSQPAMVADFVRQAQMNPDLSRSVWHTAISFSPQDEARLAADPQLMAQVATDYLAGMQLANSQYVVIRHRDTSHSHFHIVANRVANDGQTVGDGHNFSRSETLLREIEAKYCLTPMIEQGQRQSLKRVPERDHQRIALRDQVRTCLRESTTRSELSQRLSQHGVRLIVNQDQRGQPRGITFEQTTRDEQGQAVTTAFKGSKLHQDLGMGQITQRLAENQRLRALERQQVAHKLAQEPRSPLKQGNAPGEEKTPQIQQKHTYQGPKH